MYIVSRLVAVLLAMGGAVAGSGAPARAEAVFCDQQCQVQWDLQRQNALPRTDFYDPPAPMRWAPAGTLIRREDTGDYQVDGQPVTATRILDHSRTSAGRDVAASAVVLVPPGAAPRGGWPVAADGAKVTDRRTNLGRVLSEQALSRLEVVDDGAMPDVLAWTADRFAGRPAGTTCS